MILHPLVATRDCDLCQRDFYDEKTGKPNMRGGRIIERKEYGTACPPPCRDPKVRCPKGTPEEPKSLTRQNSEAYLHYLECRAVGAFPDDEIVRRNARVIRDVEDRLKERDANQLKELLLLALSR